MYVYMYEVYIYIYMCVRIYIYTYTCMSIYIYSRPDRKTYREDPGMLNELMSTVRCTRLVEPSKRQYLYPPVHTIYIYIYRYVYRYVYRYIDIKIYRYIYVCK